MHDGGVRRWILLSGLAAAAGTAAVVAGVVAVASAPSTWTAYGPADSGQRLTVVQTVQPGPLTLIIAGALAVGAAVAVVALRTAPPRDRIRDH